VSMSLCCIFPYSIEYSLLWLRLDMYNAVQYRTSSSLPPNISFPTTLGLWLWVSSASLPSVFSSYLYVLLFIFTVYFLFIERPSSLLYQERRYVMPASQQIIPVARGGRRGTCPPCKQNRPRYHSFFLYQEPDLPCGQHQVEAAGGLVLFVGRICLDNVPTFCIRSQIFPVVSIKWRPQEDLSSLWAEYASIMFQLSVSGARSSLWSASSGGRRRTCPPCGQNMP
jgi:hypothetical protein